MRRAATILAMATALVAWAAPAAAQQADAPVCYGGEIGEGARTRRVILVAHRPDSATLHLYGRPERTFVLRGNEQLQSVDGAVTGEISAGSALVRRTSDAEPGRLMALQPVGRLDVLGEWSGRVGPGGVIRLVVRLQSGPCGSVVGVFDSPDQGQLGLPLTRVRAVGDTLVLEAWYLGIRLALPSAGSATRVARFEQNGVGADVTFQRGAELRRPQEPTRPFPYGEEELRLTGHAPGIRLTGVLTLPKGEHVHPAVVLISGSGAQDRDETIAGHKPFLVLADHLTRRGYAVLRLDDRGVGGSTGRVIDAGLHDVAGDVRIALAHLRAHPRIDARRIGLIGHSEGGYIAPIVAADAPVAFMVLLGAPAVSGPMILEAQRAAMNRGSGMPAKEVAVDSMMIAALLRVLEQDPSASEVESAIASGVSRWLATLRPHERAIARRLLDARTVARDSASFTLWRSAWFRSLLRHDPAPYLNRADVPVLAIIGELDLQVPAWQSAPAFASLYAKRPGLLTVRVLPGINHMLQPARTGSMQEYMEIEQTIAPAVLQALDEWLAATVPVTGSAIRHW